MTKNHSTWGEKELCSNPALPLSGCVTLRMLAASWSLSHFICFCFFEKLLTLRRVCRLYTAQRHRPGAWVGDSPFLTCPIP